MSCGIDVEANALLESLTAGKNFDIPIIDLDDPVFDFPGDGTGGMYQEIAPITVEQLTERAVGGNGVFDALMTTYSLHIREEYDKGRITGNDYTKAYIALAENAMSQAVAFLLGKDQAFWQAQMAQVQAFTARVQLETAKVALASEQIDANTKEADYALTKARLATESENYCISKFNLEHLLPQQEINLIAQGKLIAEQTEVQRAQTVDTRTDGALVVGTVGLQKRLYEQQIDSYKRDSEVKASKLFTDAWITQKTLDEGLVPPNGFTNASIDTILTALKVNNDLD